MIRYFLQQVEVEGFRGINNVGQPLVISFKPDKLNSVFAANGLGKSSLFEALSYAIFGDVQKLASLHAAESAEDYYCNRFHPALAASITLTLAPDDGSDPIEVRVRRSSAGTRSVDSPTGYPDPSGLLESLRSDLVLLDQHTFAKFLADSPLDRGRSFSALLGLAKLSEYRQALETISHTRTLKADFGIETLSSRVAVQEAEVRRAETEASSAYRELVGAEPPAPFDKDSIAARATQALAQVALLKPFFETTNILGVDFSAVRSAIKKEEGGEKREELAAILRHQTELEGLAPIEGEEASISGSRSLFAQRAAALEATKGPLFQEMLTSVRGVLVSDQWEDDTKCPACETKLADSLLARIDSQLAKYTQADDLLQAIRAAWIGASWVTRLRKLEQSVALGIPDADRLMGVLDSRFRSGSPEVADLENAASRLADLEVQRAIKLKQLVLSRGELEAVLPPSLVELTEQVEHGIRIHEALAARAAAVDSKSESEVRLNKIQRWSTFAKAACETFAQAEVALSTARTSAIETEYRAMYEAITRNPEVVPTLQKDDRSESLLLRLERFYGLQDLSAPTLLQESYRNALAISIFLSTALSHTGAARFVVLDDVTSSFDAGHQWYLMELLRTKIARPLNADGPQLVVLSHDGLLEKYFDRMASEGHLHHQRLQGAPPSGFVFTQAQDADRLRKAAESPLKAGQVDKACPLVRQYLEFVLLGVIRGVEIPTPLDFSIRDDRKMVQNCIDAISVMVALHQAAGDLVLSQQQRHDLSNVHVPSLVSNWVSHYATASGASLTPHVLLGILDTVDGFADCFKYPCSCNGPTQQRFYRTLTSKRCGC